MLFRSEVLASVEQAFMKPRTIRTLTLSGHGEPTLHPAFDLIVAGIRSIIAKTRPETQLALFTNGTRVQDVRVQGACRLIDRVMVKLDVGDEESFLLINRPLPVYTFADLMAGLRQMPGLVLQSCLMAGEKGNINGGPFSGWVERLGELHPQEVQIYSIERPTSERSIQGVDPGKLQEIQSELEARFGFKVKAFWRD